MEERERERDSRETVIPRINSVTDLELFTYALSFQDSREKKIFYVLGKL